MYGNENTIKPKKLPVTKSILSKVFYFFKKIFTHNYCDTCGFTKESVYLTEICAEAGIIQCEKCSSQL